MRVLQKLSELLSRRRAARRIALARRRIRELSKKSRLVVGPKTWSRDDLHERPMK